MLKVVELVVRHLRHQELKIVGQGHAPKKERKLIHLIRLNNEFLYYMHCTLMLIFRITVIITISFLFISCNKQIINTWLITYGTDGRDNLTSIVADKANNIWVSYYSDYPNIISTCVKYNEHGNQLLKRDFIGITNLTVINDTLGNIYLVGLYESDSIDSDISINNNLDIVVMGIDNVGNILWTNRWGTEYDEIFNKVFVNADNNIIIAGESIDQNTQNSQTNDDHNVTLKGFILEVTKTTANEKFCDISKCYNTINNILIDGNNYYISGLINASGLNTDVNLNYNNSIQCITKFSGNVQEIIWEYFIDGDCAIRDMAVYNNDLYITGDFRNDIEITSTDYALSIAGNYLNNGIIFKISNEGSDINYYSWGGDGRIISNAIEHYQCDEDYIFIKGQFSGTAIFGKYPDHLAKTSIGISSYIIVITNNLKYASNIIWNESNGWFGTCMQRNDIILVNRDLYIGGITNLEDGICIGGTQYHININGEIDCYLLKIGDFACSNFLLNDM
jgi:hypothetical protein